MKSSKKNPPNSSCFSSILERFICSGNLPTHPFPPEQILKKKSIPTKNNVFNNNDLEVIVVKSRVQAQGSPGIVARLMGLDTLPNNDNAPRSSSSTNESLFRSKSLNSLHFLPDFDPTRATFHRRARTSSTSFHEQGNSFLGRIDENLETNGEEIKNTQSGRRDELKQEKEKREKAVVLKENECRRSKKINECKKRYQQERYYRGNNNSGTTCSSKSNRMLKNTRVREKVVGNKKNTKEKCEIHKGKLVNKDKTKKIGSIVSSKNNKVQSYEVQSDVMSRSPISVLDHQLEFDSPSREDAKATQTTSTSSSTRRPTPKINKINIIDDMPRQHIHPKSNKNDDDSSKTVASKHKLVNEDAEIAEYFANLSGQICTLAEDQLCKDIRRYELFKGHYIEELCQYFGHEMVEFLLIELTHELIESL